MVSEPCERPVICQSGKGLRLVIKSPCHFQNFPSGGRHFLRAASSCASLCFMVCRRSARNLLLIPARRGTAFEQIRSWQLSFVWRNLTKKIYANQETWEQQKAKETFNCYRKRQKGSGGGWWWCWWWWWWRRWRWWWWWRWW